MYNLCIWATTAVVVRMSTGYSNAGMLQLSMAVSNVFAIVAYYNLKIYLVSDVRSEFETGVYIGAQGVAGLFSVVLCFLYAAISGIRGSGLACVTTYAAFRAVGGASDVLFGIGQRNGRMDFVGFSQILRGVLTLGAFTVTLLLSGSVFRAVLAMTLVSAGILLVFDRKTAGQWEKTTPVLQMKPIGNLLKKCFPAVLSAAAFTAIATIPRQILSLDCGGEALGVYATVATPVVVVQVLATGIFDPAIRRASESISSGNRDAVNKLVWRLVAAFVGGGAVCFAGTATLGRWALVLIYGEGMRAYAGLLYGALGCSILYCACWVCSCFMTIVRKLKRQLWFAASALLLVVFLTGPLLDASSLNGVSLAIMAGYALFLVLGVIFLYNQRSATGRAEK